jgi:hypothetical protein
MTKKNDLNLHPDPIGLVNENLSNAYAALKSKNPIEWEVLPNVPYLAGFIGTSREKAEELIQNGKITPYNNGSGTPCFLLNEVVKLINEDPEIKFISWESYKDKEHSPEELIIHFLKWRFEDRILIKYLFKKQTFYTILKPELWRKNKKISTALIRLINLHLKAQRNGK